MHDEMCNFFLFRLEEAEAECALLNAESLCVSDFFFAKLQMLISVRTLLKPLSSELDYDPISTHI